MRFIDLKNINNAMGLSYKGKPTICQRPLTEDIKYLCVWINDNNYYYFNGITVEYYADFKECKTKNNFYIGNSCLNDNNIENTKLFLNKFFTSKATENLIKLFKGKKVGDIKGFKFNNDSLLNPVYNTYTIDIRKLDTFFESLDYNEEDYIYTFIMCSMD